MTTYQERRTECESAGYVKEDCGVAVCGLNTSVKCSGYSCPAKLYWNKAHKQMGWHKQRALEKTGLAGQFAEEMGAE